MYRSDEQQRYADAIAQAIASPGAPALIQAGTGIGKTRGFLTPALQSGKRVIITTETTQLVNQMLASSDFQAALEAAGKSVDVRPRFGLSQYVSPSRAEAAGYTVAADEQLDEVLERYPDANPRDITLTPRCPASERQAYEVQAEAARNADIVITTHAALLLDTRLKGRLLGPADVVIVDEADRLPAAAVSAFDSVISTDMVLLAADGLDDEEVNSNKLRKAADPLDLHLVIEAVGDARREVKATDTLDRLDRVLIIARGAVSAEQGYVAVIRTPSRVRVVHRHPARILRLLYHDRQVILTSGTLSIGDDFRSAKIAFGIEDLHPTSSTIEPRRHGSASFILADRSVPAPRKRASDEQRVQWLDYAAAGIRTASETGGTTLVLTTSYDDTAALCTRLTGVRGLIEHCRGERLKPVLQRTQPGGTLISPAAWAGVDATFDNIVIPRLPFPTPDEEAEREFGTSPACAFLDARADVIRRVRQAIGRGMRSYQQSCDVWILDPRFPLPSAIINRGEATQKEAAKLLKLAEAIPERFRHGIRASWQKAEIFYGGGAAT